MANKERVERQADIFRRNKIPTIRDTKTDKNIRQEFSSIIYRRIVDTNTLLVGKEWSGTPRNISFCNNSESVVTQVSMQINRASEPTEVSVIANVLLPAGATLVLDEQDIEILAGEVYAITLVVASGTPSVDVTIRL